MDRILKKVESQIYFGVFQATIDFHALETWCTLACWCQSSFDVVFIRELSRFEVINTLIIPQSDEISLRGLSSLPSSNKSAILVYPDCRLGSISIDFGDVMPLSKIPNKITYEMDVKYLSFWVQIMVQTINNIIGGRPVFLENLYTV